MEKKIFITRNPETSKFNGKVVNFNEIDFNSGKVNAFKQVCLSYESDCTVYVDLTNFSPIEIITIFSSLVYAEKVKNCYIKEVMLEGKDIRYIYEISEIIESASLMSNVDPTKVWELELCE